MRQEKESNKRTKTRLRYALKLQGVTEVFLAHEIGVGIILY